MKHIDMNSLLEEHKTKLQWIGGQPLVLHKNNSILSNCKK